MSATKSIWIEWRKPTTKAEASLYGETVFTNINTARVFINTTHAPHRIDAAEVWWHEIAHVFMHFHKRRKKLTRQHEEELAHRVAKVVMEVLK